jgi:pSer/pThr/pTyr-binding forkhead associated (FHA) protein
MEVKLIVAEGKAKGRVIPLPPTIFLIGRGPQCHLRPHCLYVSKLYCGIAGWAGKLVVRDFKSVNGTFVNDTRVEGEVRIKDGDTLRVGDLLFTFSVKLDSDAAHPVQVVREGDVRWLMDTPADSGLLRRPKTLIHQVDELLEETVVAASQGDLSAGQFLRDYFHKPKDSGAALPPP